MTGHPLYGELVSNARTSAECVLRLARKCRSHHARRDIAFLARAMHHRTEAV